MFLFLYIFLFSYSIGVFAQTHQTYKATLYSLSTEPISYIVEPLKPLFEEIPKLSQQNLDSATSYIQRYFQTLTFPQRLNDKLINFLIEKVSEFKTDNKVNIHQNILELEISSLFDFIDLLQILEIPVKDSDFLDTLVVEEIGLYQKKHFPSGDSVANLIQVMENNFQLYKTWINRSKKIPEYPRTFPIPEAKAVSLYYTSFFNLYKKVIIHPNFKEFLKRREFQKMYYIYLTTKNYSLEEYVLMLLNKTEEFNNIVFTTDLRIENRLSYSKLIEMDHIFRALLDIALSSTKFPNSREEIIPPRARLSYNRLIFLISITPLRHTPFLMTLGNPWMHLLDAPLSLVPHNLGINNLILRKQHDIKHSSNIINYIFSCDEFCEYYIKDNLESIKIAFVSFLNFCEENFSSDEINLLLNHLVDFHHDRNVPFLPISRDFVSRLLNADTNRFFGVSLSPKRQKLILKNWYRLWETFPLKTEQKAKSLQEKLYRKFIRPWVNF